MDLVRMLPGGGFGFGRNLDSQLDEHHKKTLRIVEHAFQEEATCLHRCKPCHQP
jgi:hypothetical protein